MSHQTGIHGDNELKEFFKKCRNDDLKFKAFQVSIQDEKLILSKTFENLDLSRLKDQLDTTKGCYVFYQLNKTNLNNQWLMITWAPEVASVRERMLYASTKATTKQELGTNAISCEIHCTTVEDLANVPQSIHSDGIDLKLYMSNSELEKMEMNQDRAKFSVEHGVNSRTQTLTSIAMPLSPNLIQALDLWSQKAFNYLQIKINLREEKVELVSKDYITVEQLPKNVPKTGACYHVYNFEHDYNGERLTNVNVFIYSMAGYNNCSIKERMLYSSCKNYLVDEIESRGIRITKKLEIESGDELTEKNLLEELHPKVMKPITCFDKPKGPPKRGARRIIK